MSFERFNLSHIIPPTLLDKPQKEIKFFSSVEYFAVSYLQYYDQEIDSRFYVLGAELRLESKLQCCWCGCEHHNNANLYSQTLTGNIMVSSPGSVFSAGVHTLWDLNQSRLQNRWWADASWIFLNTKTHIFWRKVSETSMNDDD